MQEQSSSTMMPTVSVGLSITEGIEVSLNAIALDADDDTITYIVIPPSAITISGKPLNRFASQIRTLSKKVLF